jgi:hypothetical protein
MEPKDLLDRIRNDVAQLLDRGQQFVHIPTLLQYLADLERNAPGNSQQAELHHQSQLAEHRAQHEAQLEMFKSVIETGQTAVNTAILVSGGASVALLAFIGNLMTKGQPAPLPQAFVWALCAFGGGVLLGAMATGARYIAQHSYSRPMPAWQCAGTVFQVVCVGLVLATYGLFAAGMAAAYFGLHP